MFLCQKCLEDNFKNLATPFSHGKCEYCEEMKICADIPSKYLIKKDCVEESISKFTKTTKEDMEVIRNYIKSNPNKKFKLL